MVAISCAIVNTFLIFIYLAWKKDIFHPVVILNAMWLFVHFLNFLLGWDSNEVVYFILILPSLMFSIGFCIAESMGFSNRTKKVLRVNCDCGDQDNIKVKHKFVDFILIIVTVAFLMYAYAFISRMGQYIGLNPWYILRLITWEHGVNENVFFKYASTPAFLLPSVLLVIAQKSKQKKDYLKFSWSLFMALVWSILRTSRTSTFMVVILLVMSQILMMGNKMASYQNKRIVHLMKRKRRKVFIFAVAFIMGVFLIVASQKSAGVYGDVSKFEFYLRSIANYTNLSSVGFVEWYKSGVEYTGGLNSFRFVYAVLSKLGLNSKDVVANSGGLFIEFEGMTTNAFTVARAYVEDFGVGFMAFMMAVFGIIHGAIYKRACMATGIMKIRFALINAMLDIPLFFQILTNQYLNVLSGWIQYVIWICVFTGGWVLYQTKTERS